MDGITEMGSTIINSPAGALGAIVAFLAAGFAIFKTYWRNDKVAEAGTKSDLGQIERLTRLLEASDARAVAAFARADLADQRADRAYNERNEMMVKMGAMTEQINQLTIQVAQVGPLRDEIGRLNQEITSLRRQINGHS